MNDLNTYITLSDNLRIPLRESPAIYQILDDDTDLDYLEGLNFDCLRDERAVETED
jgi:hypothetical protein